MDSRLIIPHTRPPNEGGAADAGWRLSPSPAQWPGAADLRVSAWEHGRPPFRLKRYELEAIKTTGRLPMPRRDWLYAPGTAGCGRHYRRFCRAAVAGPLASQIRWSGDGVQGPPESDRPCHGNVRRRCEAVPSPRRTGGTGIRTWRQRQHV